MQKNCENQTRNNNSDSCLSTINPSKPDKNVLNNGDITIKFEDDYPEKTDENLRLEHFSKTAPGNHKLKQKLAKSARNTVVFHHKPPLTKRKPSFEDDMDPITLGEYMISAKIAKEQKYKLSL
mmetsp:Transcript_28715/g.28439  ORF Transcript_28715/g.28439 Transcript_28715/m.28439 type:complete len:123 (+) Transcript_28715:250-618(+)